MGGQGSANGVVSGAVYFFCLFFIRGLILWKNLQMAVRSDGGSEIRWIFAESGRRERGLV